MQNKYERNVGCHICYTGRNILDDRNSIHNKKNAQVFKFQDEYGWPGKTQ